MKVIQSKSINNWKYLTLSFLLLIVAGNLYGQIDLADTGQTDTGDLVEISAVMSHRPVAAGKTYQAALIVDIAPDWHVNSAHPNQDFLIPAELAFGSVAGVTAHDIAYPSGTIEPLLGEEMSVYGGRVIILFEVTIDPTISETEMQLPVSFTYQACNNRECRAPETITTDLTLQIGLEGPPIHAALFESVAQSDSEETVPVETVPGDVEDNDLQRLINKYGFWGYILALGLAFLTGLLLSFSPCTYPMVPITVSIFGGQKRSLGRGFFLSLLYVGSMAVMYGIMGLIVSLVGGVFGAWLASTPVVIAIAAVFVIFSLSMFGLYDLNLPMSVRQKLGTRKTGEGVAGALVLGVIAALVVSPCVGPFVAGILLYVATAGSPVFGFLVLFVFALGLGTLYVLIGTFSSAINALPNSGTWMESVKTFFGFVLLMMAIYFLQPIVSSVVSVMLAALLLIAYGVFGGGFDRLTPELGFFPRFKKFLGIVALLVGLYMFAGALVMGGFIVPPPVSGLPGLGQLVGQSTPEGLIKWGDDLDSGMAAARAEGKPVLIDTWATWCANCKVLDKKTFGNPDVAAEAERFVTIKVQLEKAGTPETEVFMEKFGLKQYSLPTTLLLDSDGAIRKILRGVVGPEEMLAEMKKVR